MPHFYLMHAGTASAALMRWIIANYNLLDTLPANAVSNCYHLCMHAVSPFSFLAHAIRNAAGSELDCWNATDRPDLNLRRAKIIEPDKSASRASNFEATIMQRVYVDRASRYACLCLSLPDVVLERKR